MIEQEQQCLGYKISHHLLPEPTHQLLDEHGGKKNTDTPQEIKLCQIYNCIIRASTMPASYAKALHTIPIFQAQQGDPLHLNALAKS